MRNKTRLLFSRGDYFGQSIALAALVDEGDRLLQVMVEREDCPSLVGNIYIGRVRQIMPGMQSAFIELSPGLLAFYSMEDVPAALFTKKISSDKPLCQGDELVVQVTKDPLKTKQAICTSNLSFYGKDVIFTTGRKQIGVSRKIPKKKREAIKAAFLYDKESGERKKLAGGLVFRTSAGEVPLEELWQQAEALNAEYEEFRGKAVHRSCFSIVQRRQEMALSFLNQLPKRQWQDIEEIVCEEEEQYQRLSKEKLTIPLRLYRDREYPMWKLYGFEKKLEAACRPHVWMKSGASLVIETTEAMTVIDVNSSKCTKGCSREEASYMVNEEACFEIAKQLRLRNISGIIIVDFINMKREEERQKILNSLRQAVAEDPVGVQVLDYTKLGLVEMTRKKVYASLAQQLDNLINITEKENAPRGSHCGG